MEDRSLEPAMPGPRHYGSGQRDMALHCPDKYSIAISGGDFKWQA